MGESYVQYQAQSGGDAYTTHYIPPQENPETIEEVRQSFLKKFIKLRHKNSVRNIVALAVIFLIISAAICIPTVIKLNRNSQIISNVTQAEQSPVNGTNLTTISTTKNLFLEEYETTTTELESSSKNNNLTDGVSTIEPTAKAITTSTEEDESHEEITTQNTIRTHRDSISNSSHADSCPKNGCLITNNYKECYQTADIDFKEQNRLMTNTCESPLKFTLSVDNFLENAHGMIMTKSSNDFDRVKKKVTTKLHQFTVELISAEQFVKMTTCDGTCCCQGDARCKEIKSNETMVQFNITDHFMEELTDNIIKENTEIVNVSYRYVTQCACN